ncbi:MAG: RNA polymerase sigma factor [Bacteroidales bacterium]|nr:RNA polymerase sigma factor [Bacteroidales bacterium]
MTQAEYKQAVTVLSDKVMRFVQKNLRSYPDACDIVQDSLITLYNNIQDVEFAKAKSYLFTVAYRKMLNVLQQQKVRSKNLENIQAFNPTQTQDTAAEYDSKQLISHAVEQLNPVMRSCLMLKDYEGYKTSEIALIMDISEDNVKINIFRARRILRKILTNAGYNR